LVQTSVFEWVQPVESSVQSAAAAAAAAAEEVPA